MLGCRPRVWWRTGPLGPLPISATYSWGDRVPSGPRLPKGGFSPSCVKKAPPRGPEHGQRERSPAGPGHLGRALRSVPIVPRTALCTARLSPPRPRQLGERKVLLVTAVGVHEAPRGLFPLLSCAALLRGQGGRAGPAPPLVSAFGIICVLCSAPWSPRAPPAGPRIRGENVLSLCHFRVTLLQFHGAPFWVPVWHLQHRGE